MFFIWTSFVYPSRFPRAFIIIYFSNKPRTFVEIVLTPAEMHFPPVKRQIRRLTGGNGHSAPGKRFSARVLGNVHPVYACLPPLAQWYQAAYRGESENPEKSRMYKKMFFMGTVIRKKVTEPQPIRIPIQRYGAAPVYDDDPKCDLWLAS